MKLASLKGGRDGRLVVVSNDLAWYSPADRIALTLRLDTPTEIDFARQGGIMPYVLSELLTGAPAEAV